MIGNGKKSTFFDGYFKLMREYELNRPFVSKKVLFICFILMLLPVFIDAYSGISSGIKMTETEKSNLNQLSVCLKKNIQTIHEASFTDVDFSVMNEDFYSLPEVVLFTDGDIQSLTDLHAIRRSFKAHLKKYEQQDALMQKSLQPTIANEQSFLRIFLPICEKCEPWSRMNKRQQEKIIIGAKQGRLNNIENMKIFLHKRHVSSSVELRVAFLKEALKTLDILLDLSLDDSRKTFDLQLEKITEILKKESEFHSDVEKQFELKKSDYVPSE